MRGLEDTGVLGVGLQFGVGQLGVGYLGVRGESLVVLEFASLLVDPAGADNSVLYTAKTSGAGGELVSITYAAPAEQATTTVAVATNAITVTPGTKARMVVSGAGTAHANGTYLENGVGPYGKTTWRNAGCDIYYQTDRWVIIEYYEGVSSNNDLLYTAVSALDYPDGLTFTVSDGANPAPSTVTAGVSNAAQVIAAVNATGSPAAALVTASASGPSTGPVAAVAAANLALPAPPEIPANALTLDGVVLTLGGQTLTLD